MHGLFGLGWDEWASVAAILTFGSGLIAGIFHLSTMTLSHNIKELNNTLSKQAQSLETVNRRLNEHDRRLDRHHEDLKHVFHELEDQHHEH